MEYHWTYLKAHPYAALDHEEIIRVKYRQGVN